MGVLWEQIEFEVEWRSQQKGERKKNAKFARTNYWRRQFRRMINNLDRNLPLAKQGYRMWINEHGFRTHLPLVGRSNCRSAQRGGSSGGGRFGKRNGHMRLPCTAKGPAVEKSKIERPN